MITRTNNKWLIAQRNFYGFSAPIRIAPNRFQKHIYHVLWLHFDYYCGDLTASLSLSLSRATRRIHWINSSMACSCENSISTLHITYSPHGEQKKYESGRTVKGNESEGNDKRWKRERDFDELPLKWQFIMISIKLYSYSSFALTVNAPKWATNCDNSGVSLRHVITYISQFLRSMVNMGSARSGRLRIPTHTTFPFHKFGSARTRVPTFISSIFFWTYFGIEKDFKILVASTTLCSNAQ